MDIREGFSGRVIFITGGTGFLGKVLLYKILREFEDVGTIYLLMRGKRSREYKRYLTMQERLDLELLKSPCFDPLREAVGDGKWKEMCDKIKPMSGDIMEDHLGLSERDRTTVAQEVQLIIHTAATVNFNERLDLAVQMNTLGPLRVLALAKTCTKLEAMVHVSTCYVNYHRRGFEHLNEEKIYPQDYDAEEMVKAVLSIHPAEMKTQTDRYLRRLNLPNTYTFTKNMGERLLEKYHQDLPLAILRPSIIGCSYYEPTPGWVDALTAAGGLILTVAFGVVRELVCDPDKVCDIIPVDFVVNLLLKALFQTQQRHRSRRSLPETRGGKGRGGRLLPVPVPVPVPARWAGGKGEGKTAVAAAAAALATSPSPVPPPPRTPAAGAELALGEMGGDRGVSPAPTPLWIYHAATSGSENRTNWGRVRDSIKAYMATAKRHPRALGTCDVVLTTCQKYYRMRYHLMRYAPYMALKLLVKLPHPIGSSRKQDMAEKLGRAVRRADMLNWEFHNFTTNEWVFSCENALKLDEGLSEQSRKAFAFDPYAINWFLYIQFYLHGMFKNIVKDTAGFKCPMLLPSSSEVLLKASL